MAVGRKHEMSGAGKPKQAIMFRGIDGEIEELLSYVKSLEQQRDEAYRKVHEWNKDAEIQQARDTARKACRRLARGFAPDTAQWKKIHIWGERHAKAHHKQPKAKHPTKKIPNAPNYQYRFEPSPTGTIGSVTCKACERKALRNSHGNGRKFSKLCKKYDVTFFIGEV